MRHQTGNAEYKTELEGCKTQAGRRARNLCSGLRSCDKQFSVLARYFRNRNRGVSTPRAANWWSAQRDFRIKPAHNQLSVASINHRTIKLCPNVASINTTQHQRGYSGGGGGDGGGGGEEEEEERLYLRIGGGGGRRRGRRSSLIITRTTYWRTRTRGFICI